MSFSRRKALFGAGVTLSLPLLESVAGWTGKARASRRRQATPPRRLAFLYVPNGVVGSDFFPVAEGADYALTPALEPLARFRDDFTVLSGLCQKNGLRGSDGDGDHARALSSYLTAARPFKTSGANFRCGISVDQVAAMAIGGQTRLPSLELSCDRDSRAGVCDSGYACVYSYNLSWRSPTMPLDAETDPRMAFDRLFGVAPAVAKSRRSLLDFVREDARRLHRQLGGKDREKLDQYLTATREVEQRLRRFSATATETRGVARPEEPPIAFESQIKMMNDILVLAFQSDATRVVSFTLASEGSERTFPDDGVPEGHHFLSHHQMDPRKIDLLKKVDRFYTRQLAHLLDRLKGTPDGEGSLLDSCMIHYGSGLGDGNKHRHIGLPTILAGRGGGSLQPGRHIRLATDTPMANLFVSLLNRMGVPSAGFGDSTGPLAALG